MILYHRQKITLVKYTVRKICLIRNLLGHIIHNNNDKDGKHFNSFILTISNLLNEFNELILNLILDRLSHRSL